VERLRELLSYNPETGEFHWRIDHGRLYKAGTEAFTVKMGPPGNDYLVACIDKIPYRAHRVACKMFYGVEPPDFLDHIDGDRFNSRIKNLRETSQGENIRNQPVQARNKTGLKGVHRHINGKYIASFGHNKKVIYLGTFDSAEKAHEVWREETARVRGVQYREAA
jgi:hypothetical protein